MADVDSDRLASALEPFRAIFAAYLQGEMTPDAFQTEFFDLYLGSDADYDDDVFKVLDGYFAFVDSYVDDPALRGVDDAGPEELRLRTAELLGKAGLSVATT